MTPTHKRLWRWLALGLLVGLLVAGRVLAEPLAPAIDWWVVAAGGGPSSGTGVSLNSTFGQPIAGSSGGGAIALSAGYWQVTMPTSTPEMPYHVYLPAAFRNATGP